MLNAPADALRVLSLLRVTSAVRPTAAIRFHRRLNRAAPDGAIRATSAAAIVEPRSDGATASGTTAQTAGAAQSAGVRAQAHFPAGAIGHQRLPVALVVGLLLVSMVVALPAASAIGGPSGDGAGPRLAIAGLTAANQDNASDTSAVDGGAAGGDESADGTTTSAMLDRLRQENPDAFAPATEPVGESISLTIGGPFLADGTLLKPIAVDTSVSDGRNLLRTYRVKSGDTLTTIASHFDISMMTLWWANQLKTKDLHIGQTLRIPPVDGLVYVVKEGDTLEAVAASHRVDADEIYELNGLEDRVLVVGQTLLLPGAVGASIPAAPVAPKPKVTPRATTTTTHVSRPPSHYSGGRFTWPVVGGHNYISQYFHYGHYAIDIAADYGTKVVAAASGTVVFAGWKNNGGGYQVWISHGSGLYTDYCHMSAVTVGQGQSVGRGQQVGRIGMTGNATGPHLHFDVWRGGYPWEGGVRVNPLLYF